MSSCPAFTSSKLQDWFLSASIETTGPKPNHTGCKPALSETDWLNIHIATLSGCCDTALPLPTPCLFRLPRAAW
eukprot:1299138-Rhodomonas_salina.2